MGKLNRSRTIGIIAGSGPEAGIDMWGKILEANKKFLEDKYEGDMDAPSIVIHSVPELGLSMDINKYKKVIWKALMGTIRKISRDVDFFAIACNTLHYYSNDIQSLNTSAEFVSIVDVVTNYVKINVIKKLALLGAKSVMDMEDGIYSPLQDIAQIEIPRNLNEVHQLIYDIKRLGADNHSVEEKFLSILKQLNSKNILLGCTELPLVKIKSPDINLIASTDLIVTELITKFHSP